MVLFFAHCAETWHIYEDALVGKGEKGFQPTLHKSKKQKTVLMRKLKLGEIGQNYTINLLLLQSPPTFFLQSSNQSGSQQTIHSTFTQFHCVANRTASKNKCSLPVNIVCACAVDAMTGGLRLLDVEPQQTSELASRVVYSLPWSLKKLEKILHYAIDVEQPL